MNQLAAKNPLIIVAAVIALAACAKNAHRDHPQPLVEQQGHGDQHQKQQAGTGEHEGHDHGENETSDLDRPIKELFAATCEHKLKTYQCDECRYEVGVVKAPAKLFQGGLLKAGKAQRRTVAIPLSLTGEVRFDERRVAHVSTQTEGIIRRVNVTLGDRVKQGQSLIEIESVVVGEAESAYLETQGILELARRNHQRLEALRQEGIASEKELLLTKQELDAARIRVDAALGKLKRLGMNPSSARALNQANSMGKLILRAPVAGMVLEMHAVAGEVARTEAPLLTVGENSALWVWADLYERDVSLVTREQARQPLAAQVEVKAFPGEHFSGTVDFVSPAMDHSSRTVKLRIAVPNPSRRLLAGMFAGVKIFIPSDRQALTVPKSAVLDDEGRSFVFVHHQGDYFVRRPVSIGRTFAGLAEIKSGLQGDETVVAQGAFLLKSDVLRSKMGAGCAD